MTEKLIYPVPQYFSNTSHIDATSYQRLYDESIADPDTFWAKQAERLDWIKRWDSVKDTSFGKSNVSIRWFDGAQLNVAYNCVDRHAAINPDRIAIIWEGDDPAIDKTVTYGQLKDSVC